MFGFWFPRHVGHKVPTIFGNGKAKSCQMRA
jgi:hypothetical protein